MRSKVLTSLGLAAVLLVAVGMWPRAPRATVRLVTGFGRLLAPEITQDVTRTVIAGRPGTDAARRLEPRQESDLARALLAALVERGVVADDVADPLLLAIDEPAAPRDAAAFFLLDLANGMAPLDTDRPGRANTRFHARFRVWVPVVKDDRLSDGTVRGMLSQMLQHGEALPRRSLSTTAAPEP